MSFSYKLWEFIELNEPDSMIKDGYDFLGECKNARELLKPQPEVDFFFITVNPKPGITLDFLHKHIKNFITRKPVKNYLYNFEQRGESEEKVGEGLHCHMLITWERAASRRVRQFVSESFKRCVGANNNNILNIHKITGEMYVDKLEYLQGKKWDADKDDKIKMDRSFRQKNNLIDIYTKDGEICQTLPTQNLS